MIKNDIDTPLYSIPDDDDMPLYALEDDLPREIVSPDADDSEDDDFDEDDEEEIEDAPVKETASEKRTYSPVVILLHTMFTPVEGWKSLKRAKFPTDEFASRCFYPLIALAAVALGANLFYEADFTVSDWAVGGLSIFITFFFGYFTALLAGGIVLPKKSRGLLKKDIGRQLLMLTMSTLCLFGTVTRLVPMLEPVLVFLPLWTIYLIYKGVRVIRVPEDVENSTTGIMCMLVIGAPLLWEWICSEFLMPLAGV